MDPFIFGGNMPLYDLQCPECGFTLEVLHGIKEEHPRIVCEKCRNGILECVILSVPHGHVVGNTVGSIADRNASRMSNDEIREHKQKEKTKGEVNGPLPEGMTREPTSPRTPQWYDKYSTKKDSEVVKMSPERQKQYIVEGK